MSDRDSLNLQLEAFRAAGQNLQLEPSKLRGTPARPLLAVGVEESHPRTILTTAQRVSGVGDESPVNLQSRSGFRHIS